MELTQEIKGEILKIAKKSKLSYYEKRIVDCLEEERLERCIRKLPENQRIMMVLRDIKGFTYMEIAEMLKMNLGTVKSKINRARAALKEILDEDGTFLEYDESI